MPRSLTVHSRSYATLILAFMLSAIGRKGKTLIPSRTIIPARDHDGHSLSVVARLRAGDLHKLCGWTASFATGFGKEPLEIVLSSTNIMGELLGTGKGDAGEFDVKGSCLEDGFFYLGVTFRGGSQEPYIGAVLPWGIAGRWDGRMTQSGCFYLWEDER